MQSPAVITSPTCKFKTKRTGLHKPIVRGDEGGGYVCADCLVAMQASYQSLFNGQGGVFCHECAKIPGPGDLYAYVYRDVEAMILCEGCNAKHVIKIAGERAAIADQKQALVIHSVDAREQIALEQDREKKQTLYQRFKDMYGSRRRQR